MTVVVAFVSRKGGVGKSTLARALAASAARRGLITTLADLDKEQQTSTRWRRLREKRRVLPALTVEPYANVDSAICCEPDVDLLILDGPGNAPTATMEIASVAHLVVQPSGACFDDLQPAADLFYQLQGLGIPKSRLYIALSRMLSEAEEAAARAYIDVAGFSALPGVLIERIRYREAHNQGLAFIESPGEDLAAPAAATLSSLLTKIMRKHRALQPAPRKQPPALPPPAAEQRALVRS